MTRATLDEPRQYGREVGGKGQAGKKRKKSSAGLWALLLYGVGCAVGGAYLDRHVLPRARLWLGGQAQTLSGYGNEQAIRGALEQSRFSAPEREQALADVGRVYEKKRKQQLTEGQLRDLSAAEVCFEDHAHRGTVPPEQDIREALEVFARLAR